MNYIYFIILFIMQFVFADCIGDGNGDDLINILDVIIFSNIVLMDESINEIIIYDINSDEVVNILDIVMIANIVLDEFINCVPIWGIETNALPDYYFADDLSQTQINNIKDFYNIARQEWGNYGPLEFWIVGLNANHAMELDELYCNTRIEKDDCLDDGFLFWCLNREYNFVDYANNGGAGLSLQRQYNWNCEGYSYMEIILSSKSPYPDEIDYNIVTMHEYFHAYQHAHIHTYNYNERAELMVVNPWWSEGGAEYMAQLLYSKQDGVDSNHLKDKMSWKMQSKNDLMEGELISDIPYGNRAYIAYDLGTWAIAYLISMVGEEVYKVSFYDSLNNYGWEDAFYLNFNISSYQFLVDFHQFLELDISQQINILP